MYLRKYEESDADIILSWIDNERAFRLWSADRYGEYPIQAKDMNLNYNECISNGSFYPMTLVDDNNNIVGHLILRNPKNDKNIIRLGFIIVDSRMRGKGYGKALLNLAIKYATEELGANKLNLGVFKNNESAYRCYFSVGFKEVGIEKGAYNFYDENWDCVEMVLE